MKLTGRCAAKHTYRTPAQMGINSLGVEESCSQVKKPNKLTFTMLTSGPLYQRSSSTIMNVVTLLHQCHHWDNTTKNSDKHHQLNYTSSS